MISKKYIKDLELDGDTIQDFYKYIIDSFIVGSISQSKELINKLSMTQKQEFIKELNCYSRIGFIGVKTLDFLTGECF